MGQASKILVCKVLVYKIPYRRARAWPGGRVRRASKGILHTRKIPLLARRAQPECRRPSTARDDRASCIQVKYEFDRLGRRLRFRLYLWLRLQL